MKKLVMLVAVFLSLSVVSAFAADSSQFIDLCKTGGITAIQSMLTTGSVDINAIAADTGKTALMSACENTSASSLAIVGLLLNKGANVNATDVLGQTALDYAKKNVKYGDKIVPLLEQAGAVNSAIKTMKNSSATASEMATAAATAAAVKVATSEEVSTKEIANTAAQAAQETAAAKSTEPKQEQKSEDTGFFSKIKSWFSW
ncbi:MAG: ankyrin repeat domain-containing protein [Endomicrobiaceae bacterium]|nr:ankyrin repeat domain-containing protein [Endomicrobiaceae bacterium]